MTSPAHGDPVVAERGMVATSHPLAGQDGVTVLREGGNAVDAAVTAAATLSVVEPTMTSVGGDLFALLYVAPSGSVHALNASGRAPNGASLSVAPEGLPEHGIQSVTVPGAVDGWDQLLREHGTISLARALAPAIDHARHGFTVTPVVARQWADMVPLLESDPDAATTFLVDGMAPRPGDRFSNPTLATSLECLATGGRDEMYGGALADRIAAAAHTRGGWLTADDLRAHTSDWVRPLRTTFLGHEVLELPPNTQGFTALELLNLLEPDAGEWRDRHDVASYHRLVEATRIAFSDRDAYLADPGSVPTETVRRLVSKEYARTRRQEVAPGGAADGYEPGLTQQAVRPPRRTDSGDTVYVAATDQAGNAVSLIQSLYGGFGSGVVAGDTGIVLHNRGHLFSADPSHPNHLAPGKRPFHTLIPALVFEKGRPWLVFGVMGGHMQAQAHAQVLLNLLVFGMNVQQAGAAPRVRWTGEGVALEAGIPDEIAQGLADLGHQVVFESSGFGGYQGIRFVDGRLHGGSDPRKDGCAAGY